MMRRDFRISFLIVKELLGSLSAAEQRELDLWKSSHGTLYATLRDPETVASAAARMAEYPASDAWRLLDRRIRRRQTRRKVTAVAASVIVPLMLIAGLCIALYPDVASDEPVYAEICTSVGESEDVLLPDGTMVHLNSLSRLTYPETFSGAERCVSLEGQALFDVVSSDIPFVVSTSAMDVHVLGTVFDICAYPGEDARTVLVEGSVRVVSGNSAECVLAPSQMVTVSSPQRDMMVENVDPDFHTSWTRGRIYFRDERLEDIMNVLSRWYEFEVSYADEDVRELRFGCAVNRYDDIDPFFELLVKTGRINVMKEDNHYILQTTKHQGL